jgi:hypothetical protein
MARLSSNLSSAAVFGAIFWRMQKKQSNIQDRMGLLQVCAVFVTICDSSDWISTWFMSSFAGC